MFLLGVLSSIVLDWYSRRFVERHLNYFIFNPLPVPRIEGPVPMRLRIIDCAARLTGPDLRFRAWLKDLRLTRLTVTADERNDLIAELDAAVAHVYALAESELIHIFETFNENWDHADRLDATLRHYRHLKGIA